jgi:hypothetical protein
LTGAQPSVANETLIPRWAIAKTSSINARGDQQLPLLNPVLAEQRDGAGDEAGGDCRHDRRHRPRRP